MPKKNSSSVQQKDSLYDSIMLAIEPDLTSGMLPLLEEIYQGETKEEQKKRFSWYKRAFEIFEERIALFFDLWKAELADLKARAMKLARKYSEEDDRQALTDIEHSLNIE